MSAEDPALEALRRRFGRLVAAEGGLAVLALLALWAGFGLRMEAGFYAFAAVLVLAAALQVAFILAFRRTTGSAA